jgi:hypothetical protein
MSLQCTVPVNLLQHNLGMLKIPSTYVGVAVSVAGNIVISLALWVQTSSCQVNVPR